MKLTPQIALDILEPIPEGKFITGAYCNDKGCCSVGHIAKTLYPESIKDGRMIDGYAKTVENSIRDFNTFIEPYTVNDGLVDQYQQPTPKQRFIAFLKDLL